MSDLTAAKISAALRRWQREGVAVDSKNATHIAAYRLARQANDRPRSEHVLAIIASQELEHRSGAKISSDFLLVPRGNFPTGLPTDIAMWHVSEADIRSGYQVPQDVDFGTAWIVDAGCPRSGLGRGVKTISFQEILARVSRAGVDACGSGEPVPPSPVELPAVAPPESGDLVAPGTAASAPGSVDSVALVAAASTPGSDTGGPPSKRARVLRMMGSDDGITAEELEAASWEQLLGKVRSAARLGQMFSTDPGASGTVHFWSNQVLGSLTLARQAGAAGKEGQLSMLEQHFPAYLLKVARKKTKNNHPPRNPNIPEVLYSNKCYAALRHFVPLLTQFEQLGCQMPCDLKYVAAFAEQEVF